MRQWSVVLLSRLSRDEAEELLAVCAMLFGKVPVTERVNVLDDETRVFNGTAKDIDIKEVDERRQTVAPLRVAANLGSNVPGHGSPADPFGAQTREEISHNS